MERTQSFEIPSKAKSELIPQISNARVQGGGAHGARVLPGDITRRSRGRYRERVTRNSVLALSPSSRSVNDHKRKQKVLGPNQKLKFNPTELIIYCKDFRIVRFRFDESGPESAKKVRACFVAAQRCRVHADPFRFSVEVFTSRLPKVFCCCFFLGEFISYLPK